MVLLSVVLLDDVVALTSTALAYQVVLDFRVSLLCNLGSVLTSQELRSHALLVEDVGHLTSC